MAHEHVAHARTDAGLLYGSLHVVTQVISATPARVDLKFVLTDHEKTRQRTGDGARSSAM